MRIVQAGNFQKKAKASKIKISAVIFVIPHEAEEADDYDDDDDDDDDDDNNDDDDRQFADC